MRKDYLFIGIALVVLIALLLFSMSVGRIFPSPQVDMPDLVIADPGAFSRSEHGTLPEADVEVMMFEDYACPFCRQMHSDIDQLKKLYRDRVNFVYKHFPVHEGMNIPGQAAECARDQDMFWEYNDVLYSENPTTDRGTLVRYATNLGLDQTAFDECLFSSRKQDIIDQDMFEALQVGVKGTPTFFINGKMVQGIQDLRTFKTLLDQELLG